ncbi:MAG: bacteriohemerythrin [Gammaproteobacteria bacterium]|nr:bacteriohemerythrin [Gammaproteobacteria bacterium]
MNSKTFMFVLAFIILTLVTGVILGLLADPSSPITWILIISLVAVIILYNKASSKQYVEWKEEYSVGIESIDNQHKKLLMLINHLQTAVDHSTGEQFEREALDELVDYTRTHFAYEESLMEDNDYPEFEAHKEQHKNMVSEVERVLAEYQRDQETAMSNAISYLKNWLINHINGTDKQYSEFLIGKGVK